MILNQPKGMGNYSRGRLKTCISTYVNASPHILCYHMIITIHQGAQNMEQIKKGIIGSILSKIGIENRVRQSLIPLRQKVQALPSTITYENITFHTADNLRLKGWWIKGNSDITIILSHSFGSNRSGWEGSDAKGNQYTINCLPSIQVLVDAGYNIIAFDHRACGESEGELTYFGKKEAMDIVAAVQWVGTKDSHLKKFALIGFSTGANATLRAIHTLEHAYPLLQLVGIAINLYWYEKMIQNSTKFFTGAPSFLIPLIKIATTNIVGFNPVAEINPGTTLSQIKSPVMIVNSEHDEIASVATIRSIYEKRTTDTELIISKGKDRFYAYHFIEKEPEIVISYINTHLKN